jgi:hypothetical protein
VSEYVKPVPIASGRRSGKVPASDRPDCTADEADSVSLRAAATLESVALRSLIAALSDATLASPALVDAMSTSAFALIACCPASFAFCVAVFAAPLAVVANPLASSTFFAAARAF